MLIEIELLEALERLHGREGNVAFCIQRLRGPRVRGEDAHAELDPMRLDVVFGDVFLEVVVHRVRERDVLEHAFELRGELAAALGLQLRYHVFLHIIRHALIKEKSLCKILLIIAFEHIFLLEIPEQDHRLVKHALDVLLRHALHTPLQLVVDEQR